MKLLRLTVRNFTVFEDATFEFGPHVNVLIGENGTGKSHVLKLLYAILAASTPTRRHESEGGEESRSFVAEQLKSVFRPDSLDRLVRRGAGEGGAHIELETDTGRLDLRITQGAISSVTVGDSIDYTSLGQPIFLPPREVLSLFPGFISLYQKRELAFDSTYYDLCVALDASRLRGRDAKRDALLAPIEKALGGPVIREGSSFYLDLPSGKMEVPLVAEGLRKLAMLAQLINNGSLAPGASLFWDEPEANINPKLIDRVSDVVLGLGGEDVQVFLATHDYMLTSQLSLAVETAPALHGKAAFFSLRRPNAEAGVVVEQGEVIADLQENPILDAYTELHEREREAFAKPEASA